MNSIVIAVIIISVIIVGLGLLYCYKAKPYIETESEMRAIRTMMLLQVLYQLLLIVGLMIYPDGSQTIAIIVFFSICVYNIVFFIFADSISSIARRAMAAGAWTPFRGDVTTSATSIRIQSGMTVIGIILVLIYFLAL